MKRVLGVVWGLIGLVPAWACMPESAVAARASAAGEFQPGRPARIDLAHRSSGWLRRRLKAAHEDVDRLRSFAASAAGLTGPERLPGDPARARRRLGAHRRHACRRCSTDAKKAGVNAIFLTDHSPAPHRLHQRQLARPARRRALRAGLRGRGFLLLSDPLDHRNMNDRTADLIKATRADGGLIFLSHIEERPDHSMAGLDGMEIYNRHADAKKDAAGLLAIMLKLTDPRLAQSSRTASCATRTSCFASQVEYPADYLAKWDAETQDAAAHRRCRQRLPSQLRPALEDGRLRKHRPDRYQRRSATTRCARSRPACGPASVS